MRHPLAVLVGLLFAVSTAGFADGAPVAPTAAAVNAYNEGQAYERLFEDHLMPGTCGIALERARCTDDLHVVEAMRAPDSTDAAMEKWLVTGDIAAQVKEWNGIYIPESTWASEPTFAWWYTAGQVSIAASLPEDVGTTAYLSGVPSVLDAHGAATPDGYRGVVPATGTPRARLRPLQSALDEAIPLEPYPRPSFGSGVVSYAQLGVYLSTLQQLVDNPMALSRPESRAFATIILAKMQRLHKQFADGLSLAGVQDAANVDVPGNAQLLDTTWREPLSTEMLNTKWPLVPRKAFLLGYFTAQVAYNAAVLKDRNADAQFRGILAHLPAWPNPPAKVIAEMAALQRIPSGGANWDDINAAATRAVLDITGSR